MPSLNGWIRGENRSDLMDVTSILVHGGAGPRAVDDDADGCMRGCAAAAEAGYAVLQGGGSALDAVQRAVIALEDDPQFNAGVGSALDAEGNVELDAMLMDGATLGAGGVGALRGYRNAIEVARAVLDHTPHVLLVADGAARFARARGIASCDPESLVTERARRRWRRRAVQQGAVPPGGSIEHGTVGAVARDRHGHVAAATSTGGLGGKLPGRVGDTPQVGAGTYADDGSGAASATGHGESILRVVLSKYACDRIAAGDSPDDAARAAMRELERVRGEGGIILVSPAGELGAAFNAQRMARAWIDARGARGGGFG